jgi:hypothetical protein
LAQRLRRLSRKREYETREFCGPSEWSFVVRDRDKEQKLLTDFYRWLEKRPDAGMVVAVVEVRPASPGYQIDCASVDCTVAHLVALADVLLGRAGEQSAAAFHRDPLWREYFRRIERARIALDFSEDDTK